MSVVPAGAAPFVDGDCRSAAAGCPAEFRPYIETGVASWYGPGFHGRKTASGAVFDQDAMTAAHRTLPLGTEVRVIRIDDGRSVTVTINDRGPYIDGRVIDLSRRAAAKLDMREEGIVPVRVTVVGEPPIVIADNDSLPAALVGADPEPAPLPEDTTVLVAETLPEDGAASAEEEASDGPGDGPGDGVAVDGGDGAAAVLP
ncbi:septal ring lytic transglycosylase RlpA family protein [Azospirillum sp. A39]|uniref:septal ring lytic transglycosylase RlpA family protein n=1 Tax=Azospirillum sp. A39 TaxID=3462279 RepID=UPI004045339A